MSGKIKSFTILVRFTKPWLIWEARIFQDYTGSCKTATIVRKLAAHRMDTGPKKLDFFAFPEHAKWS